MRKISNEKQPPRAHRRVYKELQSIFWDNELLNAAGTAAIILAQNYKNPTENRYKREDPQTLVHLRHRLVQTQDKPQQTAFTNLQLSLDKYKKKKERRGCYQASWKNQKSHSNVISIECNRLSGATIEKGASETWTKDWTVRRDSWPGPFVPIESIRDCWRRSSDARWLQTNKTVCYPGNTERKGTRAREKSEGEEPREIVVLRGEQTRE